MRATGLVEDTLAGLVEVWEPLLTTEETVWETRGPIWARIWATRSEVEEEEVVVVVEPGLRMRRESWPEEEEREEEDCPEVREVVDVVDCPPVLDDWPATADVTV